MTQRVLLPPNEVVMPDAYCEGYSLHPGKTAAMTSMWTHWTRPQMARQGCHVYDQLNLHQRDVHQCSFHRKGMGQAFC